MAKCIFCGTRNGSRYTIPKPGTTTNERIEVPPPKCCNWRWIEPKKKAAKA